MKIDKERMLARLWSLARVGETADGVCREAFTSSYFEGVARLKSLLAEEGLEVDVDAVGNVYGRLAGTNPAAAPVMVGSHLDTVKNGGLYDGVFGVAAALECMAAIRESGLCPERDIELVAFNAEEGGLLGGTFGSRVAAGNQDLDLPGTEEKLAAYGLTPQGVRESKLSYTPHCYLELHIEQGIQLSHRGLSIGIAEGIVGITRFKITVSGMANHAGTTPMSHRRDALVAASHLILAANRLASLRESPFVATVGKLTVSPNSVNVIPGQVEMILELREMRQEVIDRFMDEWKAEADGLEGFEVTFEPYSHKESVFLDRGLTESLESICQEQEVSYQRMYSGAGHDAMEMAKITKAALLFIPSRDGVSHSKMEYSSEDDMERGAQLLLQAVSQLAGVHQPL